MAALQRFYELIQTVHSPFDEVVEISMIKLWNWKNYDKEKIKRRWTSLALEWVRGNYQNKSYNGNIPLCIGLLLLFVAIDFRDTLQWFPVEEMRSYEIIKLYFDKRFLYKPPHDDFVKACATIYYMIYARNCFQVNKMKTEM